MALLCFLGFALAAYTQLAHLTAVPGLHFDEAWQGLFAHKILAGGGSFLPLEAMNSYTTPIVHYALALVFAKFGPTLEAMRLAYAAMNLTTAALIAGLLWRLGERKAVAWFLLLWALLPLSVHDHRFYIEMTGFFGFCLALLFWGLALWYRAPKLSFALIVLALAAGSYSHVLFIANFFAGIFILARSFGREFRSARAQALVATLALTLLPLPLRMGIVMGRVMPLLMAGALVLVFIWAAISPRWVRFDESWNLFPRRSMRLAPWFFVASVPFLSVYVLLLWNGFWPYAQATGHLRLLWVPLNAAIFIWLMLWQTFRRRHRKVESAPRVKYHLSTSVTWGAFVTVFLFSSALIPKQTPRFYMVPTILAMVWCAQRLARVASVKTQGALALVFIAFNLWAFQSAYIGEFQTQGPRDEEFRLWIFHDSGRDFRPFQKAFDWARSQNCHQSLKLAEDDRFLRPIEFLQLGSGAELGACPWKSEELFFSRSTLEDSKLKLLAHEPNWGDLAIWRRVSNEQSTQ